MKSHYLLFGLFSLPVSAATASGSSAGLLQWLFSSLFVLGLIIVLAWMLKKSRLVPQIGRADFKVLFSLPVGYKEKLLVVQAGEQQLLLGVTAQQITFLSQITPPLSANSESSAFAHHLSRWMNKSNSVEDKSE